MLEEKMETAPVVVREVESVIRIEIDADPTVSYASYQNAVPLAQSIRIINDTDTSHYNVEVRVITEPAFTEPLVFRFEQLAAGESRTITPVVFRFNHAYLSELTEAERAFIQVSIHADCAQLKEHAHETTILAFDQWGGTRMVPELLAAFCTPNNPHVDRLLAEASERLLSGTETKLDGYTSKNRQNTWTQCAAIYAAIAARGLQYSVPPASFTSNGQKIRLPDRMLTGGVGTCLDFTLLVASCLEQAGLNPIILLNEGHAWLGCWLVNTSFAHSITDDPLAVRKRIDAGELMVFETTGLSHRPAMTLKRAEERGYAHLREDAEIFSCAIDVRRARLERITPIPSKGAAPLDIRELGAQEVLVESAPVLPPLLGESLRLDEDIVVETADGRLTRWKAKLLDLTLRNRLLNFKPTKVMLELMVPEPALLEDAISDAVEWKFRAAAPIMTGTDPRSMAHARATAGSDPRLQQARDAMAKHELLVVKDPAALDKSLNEIFLNVRMSLEESGANTLFLAMGFLRWAEDEAAERTYLAPLILIPVTLKRESLRAGYSITRHDDDTLVNPTLLQALRDKYGVNLMGLDQPPQDGKGLDVERIFAIFRDAVKEIPRWEVVTDCYLGVFSFAKYVMYADLKNRAEDLRRNKVVAHLIDRKENDLEIADLRRRDDLDDRYAPDALLTPISADSSQLNAVRHAEEGKNFVLLGPPGTGKSQTITNVIGHFLAQGKTVLFVSEKMAALGVVERRLRSIGLGPFCLQLHSAKAIKAEVLEQLNSTLTLAGQAEPWDWARQVEGISRLRNDLNGIVAALHRKHPNGLTVRAALDTVVQHRRLSPCNVARAESAPLSREDLASLERVGADLQAIAVAMLGEQSVDSLIGFPLLDVKATEWSHRFESEFVQHAGELVSIASELQRTTSALLDLLHLSGLAAQPADLANLHQLCVLLLSARALPVPFAENPHPVTLQGQLAKAAASGEARNEALAGLAGVYKPSIATLRAAELESTWDLAQSEWFVPKFFKSRKLLAVVGRHSLSGKRITPVQLARLIPVLAGINRADQVVIGSEGLAHALPDIYNAIETDWTEVRRRVKWSADFDAVLAKFVDLDHPERFEKLSARARALAGSSRALIGDGCAGEKLLLQFRKLFGAYQEALSAARKRCENDAIGADAAQGGVLPFMVDMAAGWSRARESLREWCAFRLQLRNLAPLGFADAADMILAGGVRPHDIARHLTYSHHHWWLKGAMDRDQVLRSFNGAVHDQKIVDFQKVDEDFQSLTRKLIAARLSMRAAGLTGPNGPKTELAILSREVQKQRRHLPIRKLVRGIPNLLPALKPCLLMSPLSVANYLDPAHTQFDVVLFDEASQIPVWDAVGVIARGKQVIVVGDPKQLPPTAFFGAGEDDEASPEGPDDFTPPDDLESILNECLATGMSKIALSWHYRSRYESLIAFSNQKYYDNDLLTFPSPVTSDTAVRLIQVNGTYDRGSSQTNRAEAEAVVDRLISHFQSADPVALKHTIGVVTFNQKQMRLIDDLLAAAIGKHPEVEARMAAHGDERPFIKNLENVQGDERDIILFSTTFGKDKSGKGSMNFGPINNTGGERRLNVAITRARRGVEIYTSLRPEDIDLSKSRAIGVAHLKAYLDFALRGPSALASESRPTGRGVDSPLEREIINAIQAAGWECHPQVGCAGYRIDIGVVDRGAPGRYLLGVECDGATYHSMATARDRDRLRQSVLEDLGWELARVWSTEWWLNRARCTEKLVKVITAAQERIDKARTLETTEEMPS